MESLMHALNLIVVKDFLDIVLEKLLGELNSILEIARSDGLKIL